MKLLTLKMLFAGMVLTLPLAAQAYSTHHTPPGASLNTYQNIVQQYADNNGRPAPTVAEYTYGMKLDVAKVVFKSPLDKTCQVVPRLMIYEDSKGSLNALQYQAMSECRSNN